MLDPLAALTSCQSSSICPDNVLQTSCTTSAKVLSCGSQSSRPGVRRWPDAFTLLCWSGPVTAMLGGTCGNKGGRVMRIAVDRPSGSHRGNSNND